LRDEEVRRGHPKALAGQTGQILRHTYRTIAQRVGLDETEARLLLDHAVPGIEGVCVHERALFDRLLVAQERMTEAVFELCEAGDGKKMRHRPPARFT
jgi:hypothetical protein